MRPVGSPILRAFSRCWRAAIAHAARGAPRISVLFSGGLDSSLVAFGLRELAELELVTVGVPGSPDLTAAEEGARLLDLRWTHRTINRRDVEKIVQDDRAVLEEATLTSRAVLVSTALALEAAGCHHVVCGQGADELFLGYAHFEPLAPHETAERRRADLEHLTKEDWPRSGRLADRRGKTLTSPFLASEVLDFATGLPIEQLMAGTERKQVLRDLARYLGLPEKLAGRRKRAFQYGSGVDRLLRSLHDGD